MDAPPAPLETDASILSFAEATSTSRTVNGVRLHAVTAGDADDPLVVLLHGFPEFWYAWREQIEPLVEAGYRVVVPDQRGYNLSEKPQDVRAYQLRDLSRDIVDLIASEGRETAHVVGHDWGGAVGWDLALRYPDVVDRLAIINAPHPVAFRQQLASNPEQLRRSWYVLAFQLPWLPEGLCRVGDFRLLERALRETASPRNVRRSGAGSLPSGLGTGGRAHRDAELVPGARTLPAGRAAGPPLEQPTVVVWGEEDEALVPELGLASVQFCERGRLERLPETSHWVPHEEPERTTDLLLDHLR
ncbi:MULTISPECIES: alpha/beta fold hydrolase [Natrialbaceae]|uniref:alpha/beta fold hydrolase n=1 Tax=Natrialbaceae TaxID=1644061 RepID=UPI00207C8ABA|nr:alpha/beta hydrolase [Natronococcus sp. CG52]